MVLNGFSESDLTEFKKLLMVTNTELTETTYRVLNIMEVLAHMIFPSVKVFFIHIPKTAGTSFREMIKCEYVSDQSLELLYRGELDLRGPNHDYINRIRSKLPQVRAFYGHFSYGAHEFLNINNYSYVTILRRPVDRVISLYNHFARDPASEYHKLIHDGMSLADFIENRVTTETNNHMTRIIAGIVPINGVIVSEIRDLSMALENIKKSFCFVGLSEQIQESSDRMGMLLGWEKHLVQWENVTTDKIINLNDLDHKTLEVIKEHNTLDTLLYERVQGMFSKDWRFRNDFVKKVVSLVSKMYVK